MLLCTSLFLFLAFFVAYTQISLFSLLYILQTQTDIQVVLGNASAGVSLYFTLIKSLNGLDYF